MSFNPQGYQFTALPTNLRGKIQPNQLAVLWVIQSYASKNDQQCRPSLKTIANNACLSKRTAQKVVNQLVSLGLLERTHQTGKNGEQNSNLYKVTVLSAHIKSKLVENIEYPDAIKYLPDLILLISLVW